MMVDLAIIGGGLCGTAVAHFLHHQGFVGTIALIERDKSYQFAASTLSAAGIRQQFSRRENIMLSRTTLDMIRNPDAYGLNGVEFGFREQGYLLLSSTAGRDVHAKNHAVQRAADAPVDWLEPDALAGRFPWLNVANLGAGTHGIRGEGWFDPHGVLQALRGRLRSAGIHLVDAEITGLETGGGVHVIRSDRAEPIEARQIVIASGPQSGAVAALAGLDIPVQPRKRSVFVFSCRTPPHNALPLLVDPTGVYVRPEGSHFICGVSPPETDDPQPAPDDFEPQWALFDEVIWPVLAERIPAFEAIKLERAWAGHYDMNLFDQNGIIGTLPLEGWHIITGFSGHGVQQALAAGLHLARQIISQSPTEEIAAFGPARIAEGRPFAERNII